MTEEEQSEKGESTVEKGPSWFVCRVRAFGHAGRGVWFALRSQAHFQIHVLATIAVVSLGFVFGITAGEWIAVLLCIGSVMAAETMNTAIESLSDAVTTEHHPLIGKAKDAAAGAVLILAIISAIVGAIIFVPYLFG